MMLLLNSNTDVLGFLLLFSVILLYHQGNVFSVMCHRACGTAWPQNYHIVAVPCGCVSTTLLSCCDTELPLAVVLWYTPPPPRPPGSFPTADKDVRHRARRQPEAELRLVNQMENQISLSLRPGWHLTFLFHEQNHLNPGCFHMCKSYKNGSL